MANLSFPFTAGAEVLHNRFVRVNSDGDAIEYATDSARCILGVTKANVASGAFGTYVTLEPVVVDTAADLAAGTPVIGGTNGQAASGAALTGVAARHIAGYIVERISATQGLMLPIPQFAPINS